MTSGTYIDLISLVSLEQVVHNGTPVQFCQGGHVVHALLIHGVHSRHLLVGNCALLVGEYLTIVCLEDDNAFCTGIYSTWKMLAVFFQPDPCSLGEEVVHCSALPKSPGPAARSRKSAHQQVRGNHACHGSAPRNSSPRSSPAAIARSRLVFLTFCSPKPQCLTHPSQLQPLSLLPRSSSLLR